MPISQYSPYFYPAIAGCCLFVLLFYWQLYKRKPRLANWLVFFALMGMICYLIDWNYVLNNYFIIKSWKIG